MSDFLFIFSICFFRASTINRQPFFAFRYSQPAFPKQTCGHLSPPLQRYGQARCFFSLVNWQRGPRSMEASGQAAQLHIYQHLKLAGLGIPGTSIGDGSGVTLVLRLYFHSPSPAAAATHPSSFSRPNTLHHPPHNPLVASCCPGSASFPTALGPLPSLQLAWAVTLESWLLFSPTSLPQSSHSDLTIIVQCQPLFHSSSILCPPDLSTAFCTSN